MVTNRKARWAQKRLRLSVLALALICITGVAFAQGNTTASIAKSSVASLAEQDSQAPVTVTLADALQRAKTNSPQFRAALAEYGVAREDRVQARAALLPSVTYNNQYLYTEGNGTPIPRFIANNAVHEYISQGNAHEVVGWTPIADYRRPLAAEAGARARAEIAARGLVVTVVQNYYALISSQRKYATTQQASQEAQRFLKISQDLERGGEVAHADVVKAQLQFNDRQRDLRDAQLNMERARIELALLLFPNFNQNFEVVDDIDHVTAVPPLDQVEEQAKKNNPQLASAMAVLREAAGALGVARSGYLPTLALDYWYGIDSSHFAVHEPFPSGMRNLGNSASATLNIPIWNWGTTHSRIKQGELRRNQAKLELSFAQRRFLGDLHTLYAEAETVHAELETLRQSAELAAESLRLTTLRYQGGESTVLEVVDAQNTLTSARNAYDDGQARYRVALANLQTLTGSF